MKSFLGILFSISVIALSTSGCTQTQTGAATGALAGGALGGVIGHQSGETGAGAAIGAGAGALIGAAVGHSQEHKAAQSHAPIQLCPHGHEVDVSGYGPGALVRCPLDNSTFTVQ